MNIRHASFLKARDRGHPFTSTFSRRGRCTRPKCCSIFLSACKMGTRLASARHTTVRQCAFPRDGRSKFVLSVSCGVRRRVGRMVRIRTIGSAILQKHGHDTC